MWSSPATMETNMETPSKDLSIDLPNDSTVPLLRIIPLRYLHINVYTALLIIAVMDLT